MEVTEVKELMEKVRTTNLPVEESSEDPDGLYYKYRVFREPDDADDHPVPMDCEYHDADNKIRYMEEVKEFVFVLKPDSDPHARVALAAYGQSVRSEKPQLYDDLWEILRDL